MITQKKPLVSVRIIVYQNAPYISECIESVLMQKTDFPFEICIGEDGSIDGTREICIEYSKKYPELIRLFLWDRNDPERKGLPPARFNFLKTLSQCRGKYIALLDGDDQWTDPLKLQKQVSFLENNKEYNLTCHKVKTVFEDVDEHNPVHNFEGNSFNIKDSLQRHFIPTISIVMRRSSIPDSFPGWFYKVISGDKAIYNMALARGNGYYFNEIMGFKRKNPTSLTMAGLKNNPDQRMNNLLNIITLYSGLNEFTNKEYEGIINKKLISKYFVLSFYKLKKRDFKDSMMYFFAPFKIDFRMSVGYILKKIKILFKN